MKFKRNQYHLFYCYVLTLSDAEYCYTFLILLVYFFMQYTEIKAKGIRASPWYVIFSLMLHLLFRKATKIEYPIYEKLVICLFVAKLKEFPL